METQGTGTQNTNSNGLKQKLQKRIAEARQRADELQRDLDAIHKEDKEALRQRRDEVRKRLDAQKDKATELRANAQAWAREKGSHTKEAITSWKQKREVKKLAHRAERAEDYAVDAVNIAILDIDAAGEAMLDALDARLDADAAASAPAT
jgi:hypothetical protein